MQRLCAALLAALLTTACATAPEPAKMQAQSQVQPAYPEWRHLGRTSYESQRPGLGVSHKYAASAGWIDVYVYNLQRSTWAPGVSDPAFAVHFRSAIEEVRLVGATGAYAGLQVGPVQDVTIGGQEFRKVTFRFTRDGGKPVESATYLTARNGSLLKYRISLWAPAAPSLDDVARRFIEQNLREQQQAGANSV